jgi:hypothetical protein
MTRGRRVRLEAGIYRDALGLAAVVTVQHQRQEKRFDADTDLQQLRIWRADTTAALLKRSQLTSDRGTFAREVARFLRARRKGRPSYKRRSLASEAVGRSPSAAAAAIRSPARASSSCSRRLDRRPAWRRARSGTACASCAKSSSTAIRTAAAAEEAEAAAAGEDGADPGQPRRHRARRAEPRDRPHAAQAAAEEDADADPRAIPLKTLRALPRLCDVRPAAGADRRAEPATSSSSGASGSCGRRRAAIRSCCRSTTTWCTRGRCSCRRAPGAGSIPRASRSSLRRHGWPKGVRRTACGTRSRSICC